MKQRPVLCPWPSCAKEVTFTFPDDQTLICSTQDDSRPPWPTARSQEAECTYCHQAFCIWTV